MYFSPINRKILFEYYLNYFSFTLICVYSHLLLINIHNEHANDADLINVLNTRTYMF